MIIIFYSEIWHQTIALVVCMVHFHEKLQNFCLSISMHKNLHPADGRSRCIIILNIIVRSFEKALYIIPQSHVSSCWRQRDHSRCGRGSMILYWGLWYKSKRIVSDTNMYNGIYDPQGRAITASYILSELWYLKLPVYCRLLRLKLLQISRTST